MIDLDDAWDWYGKAHDQFKVFGRIGRNHWDLLPSDGTISRDDRLKGLESRTMIEDSEFCLEHLDDFAVLILFSVFESIVRDRVIDDIRGERQGLSHDLLVQIVDRAVREIESGSFYRILEFFRTSGVGLTDLVEEVNQVRRYRNWVAHGRRTNRPDAVDPLMAYSRLKRFLLAIAP